MGILSDIFSETKAAVGDKTYRDLSSFCLVETGYNDLLIGFDGSLGTVLEVAGTNMLGSADDLEVFRGQAHDVLKRFMKTPGYAVQFYFIRNPENSKNVLAECVKPMYDVARKIGLDMADILDEKVDYVSKHTVDEAAYIILWTRPAVLSKPEQTQHKKELKNSKPSWWPQAADAQNFDRISNILLARHKSFIESFASGLGRVGVKTSRLTIDAATRLARFSVYQKPVPKWRPYMPSMKAKGATMPWPRQPVIGREQDVSHLLWPNLPSQIFDHPAILDNGPGVVMDGIRYAPIDISRGPSDLKSFNALIESLRDMGEEPPWRMSFLLEGGALQSLNVTINSMIAALTAPFFSTASRLYAAAIKDLQNYQVDRAGTACRIRMCLATWAPANDTNLLDIRINRIQRAIEGWGGCETKMVSGDLVESLLSSVPGIDIRATAPAGIAPLPQALSVLPWMRESSPWDEGSVLLRTRDGRPFPYQAGSSRQDAWVDIVYGAMGKGKSFLMNTLNLAFCLSPEATSGSGGFRLPRLSIVDFGSSSSGLINLLKSALPIDRKHEVIFHRLQMSRSNNINPFDLPPGLTKPLPHHRDYLRNILTTIASHDLQGEGFSVVHGMVELVTKVIDEAYKLADDTERTSSPKMFSYGENKEVDELLDRLGIDPGKHRTWYAISRALFAAGRYREAKIAMRYGVPRLQDLLITENPNIAQVYADDPSIPRLFERMIQLAINDYPIIAGVTELDFSSARVLSMDLTAVAPKGNIKQTTIMLLAAMHISSGDFYLHEDDLKFFPEEYRPYYKTEDRTLVRDPEASCYRRIPAHKRRDDDPQPGQLDHA